jgi:alanine dehydrogenase
LVEFGVPREVRDLENRVGLTPAGVYALAQAGHKVYIERNAGLGAGFADENYRAVGGHIVYSAEEAYGRADMVTKFSRPTAREHELLRPGQTVSCFFNLAVASPDLIQALRDREITALAWETVQAPDGALPCLGPISEVAGRLAPIIAGQLLQTTNGGRGILLSGMAGVAPAAVVIIGAGVLGTHAARAFMNIGAQVTVLDHDIRRLQRIDELLGGQVQTLLSTPYALNKTVEFADVVVGCVYVPGERAPILVTREMVRRMRPRSVIMDFSIDNGGCVATSRPTTHRDPTFIEEGVIHFCVPNVPARVARTASYALTNSILPYLLAIGEHGIEGAIRRDPALARGINVYRGRLAHRTVAAALGLEAEVEL